MMKLISATPSPYARKVRIALAEKAVPFELVAEVPWNSDTTLPRHNPLEKLPVLVLEDGRQVARDIEALVAEAAAGLNGARATVEFKGFMADGCTFPAEQPIARAVSALHEEITGRELRHYAATGLTDARFYALYQGTQATCYGPDSDNIHGIDESVGLESVHQVTRVLALTIAGWCGVERASG